MKTLILGINSKYIHPSMGAHQIIVNSNYDIKLLEFTIKDNINDIINIIYQQDFDILAISTYIWNIEITKTILKSLDSNNFNKPILLGGPEASYDALNLMNNYNINYIIKNEGEESFNKLIHSLIHDLPLDNVPNLYYKFNNVVKYTYDLEPNILNIKHDYSLIGDLKNRIVYLEASRGCYFRCSYCLASLEKNVRFFDVNMIKEELKYLLTNNAKIIKFLDRSFNVNKAHMLDILSFIKEHDNKYTTFQFEIVGDLLDEEVIDFINSMRKDYLRFEIGIQSFNEKTIKAVSRTQNFDKLKSNIEKLKHNAVIHADLIAGLPYENKDSFINTFNQAFTLFIHELQLGFLKELKGTVISLTKDIHEYEFSNTSPYEVIKNKYISKEDLEEITKVEKILDVFYNKGYFYKTNMYIFKDLLLNPYMTFLELYEYITNLNLNIKRLQVSDISKLYYEFLSTKNVDKDKLLYIIKQDYLTRSKVRPKIWWNNSITKEERNFIYNEFVTKYKNIKLNDLYKYAKLEKYNNEYFVVIYYSDDRLFLELKK